MNKVEIKFQKDKMLKRSKDSLAMLPYWNLTDAIVTGVEALRDAGEDYLPKFLLESEEQYTYRKKLTKFTNVYRDTIESLTAKPFEEEVALKVDEDESIPTDLVDFVENVDGAGNNLTMFSNDVFFNAINSAVDWIFVDYPKTDKSKTMSVAEAKKAGNRPFWSRILGRNVLEAKAEMINGEECLTYIRIYEPGEPDKVRIMKRDGKLVSFELYQDTGKFNPKTETAFVRVDGGDIDVDCVPCVPFATGRRIGRTFRYHPVMRDAADLSIELYQDESGLKFIKRLSAYPMLSGNGVKPVMEEDGKTPKNLAVGPGRVLYAPPNADGSPGGKWEYVEPSSESMKFLAEDIVETKRDLRELGRQPLTAQSGNLTVITTQVAATKARSAVASWALGLKNALEKAMDITCQWYGIKQYKPQVEVYTEFDDFIEGKDYQTLLQMRKDRDISHETFMSEMKRRGLLSPEYDQDIELSRLLAEGDFEVNDEDDETETETET